MIEKPQYVAAQGGGFSAAYQQRDAVVPKNSAIQVLAPAISQFSQKYIKTKQDDAFLEGVTDHAAGAIEEQSWLTREQYNQGVNYSVFGGKLNEANEKIAVLAQESAKNGDTTQVFNQKIKEVMFGVNAELDKLGLSGDARKLAQKQILEVPVTSLKAFEKRRQEEFTFNVQAGNASMVNNAMNTMRVSGFDPNTIADTTLTAYASLVNTPRSIGSKNPFEDAGKDLSTAMVSQLKAMNMADPQNRDVLNRFSAALGSDSVLGTLDNATTSKLRDAIVDKQKEAMQVQGYELGTEMTNLKLAAESGGFQLSREQATGMIARNAHLARTGVITVQEAEQRDREILGAYEKANQSNVQATNALYGTASSRLGNLTDEEASKMVGAHAAKMYPNDPAKISSFMISTGIKTDNPKAIEDGAKFLTKNFLPMLNMTKEELAAEGSVSAQQADSFKQYAKLIKQYPGRANVMLDAISDPRVRSEVVAYMVNEPTAGANVQADMRKIQENLATVRTVGDADGNIKFGKATSFTKEDFQEGFISKWNPWSDRVGTAGSTKATDEIAERRAMMLNNLSTKNKSAIVRANGGVVPQTKLEVVNALTKMGKGLMLDDGMVEWSRDFQSKLGVQVQGKFLPAKPEAVAATIEGMRTQHAATWKVPRESVDVMLEPLTGLLIFYGVDSNGIAIQKRQVTERVVNENLQSEYNRNHQSVAAAVSNKPIANLQKAGQPQFTMTQGWQETALGHLGTKLATRMHAYEGFVDKPTNTRSAKDQQNPNLKQVHVMGLGVSLEDHPKWAARFKAVSGNPVAISALNAEFAKDYFKDTFEVGKQSGLHSGLLNDPKYEEPILALAYSKWLGGKGGAMEYALVLRTAQTDVGQALNDLKRLAIYKQAGTQNGARDSLVRAVQAMPIGKPRGKRMVEYKAVDFGLPMRGQTDKVAAMTPKLKLPTKD